VPSQREKFAHLVNSVEPREKACSFYESKTRAGGQHDG